MRVRFSEKKIDDEEDADEDKDEDEDENEDKGEDEDENEDKGEDESENTKMKTRPKTMGGPISFTINIFFVFCHIILFQKNVTKNKKDFNRKKVSILLQN